MDYASTSWTDRAVILIEALKNMMDPATKARAFDGYYPCEHDVIVAAFPKSGTNWAMQMALQVAHRGEAEFDHINNLVAWPDHPGPMPPTFAEAAKRVVVKIDDPAPIENSPTSLRIINTHIEAGYCPYSPEATYVIMIRDPKEVLVSSYYFLGGVYDVLDHINIETWFKEFIKPGWLLDEWVRHTASYWNWEHFPNVIIVPYTNCKKYPKFYVEMIADTMEVELTSSQVGKIVKRSSFEYMQRHESQFGTRFFVESMDQPIVRRGQAGGTNELLSPEQQVAIDGIAQQRLARLGSTFPYAQLFMEDIS